MSPDDEDEERTAEDVEREAAEEEEALYKTFAADQLSNIVESYSALEKNIEKQFVELENILMDTNITVQGFDPDDADDLAWLASEMDKMLASMPEIAAMEQKIDNST
jgi:hypothetical protein